MHTAANAFYINVYFVFELYICFHSLIPVIYPLYTTTVYPCIQPCFLQKNKSIRTTLETGLKMIRAFFSHCGNVEDIESIWTWIKFHMHRKKLIDAKGKIQISFNTWEPVGIKKNRKHIKLAYSFIQGKTTRVVYGRYK